MRRVSCCDRAQHWVIRLCRADIVHSLQTTLACAIPKHHEPLQKKMMIFPCCCCCSLRQELFTLPSATMSELHPRALSLRPTQQYHSGYYASMYKCNRKQVTQLTISEWDIRIDFDTNKYPNIFVSRK